MKAMILAAGKNQRMRRQSGGLPKVLLPVAGKPILEHNLLFLKKYGIKEIVMNLHYRAEMIQKFIETKRYAGLNVHFSYEKKLLGTAGGVKKAEKYFKGRSFLILYGDNLLDFRISNLIKKHRKHRPIITLGVFDPRKTVHSGILAGHVKLGSTGRVIRFVERRGFEKKKYPECINAGIMIASPRIFKFIPSRRSYDFSKQLFPLLLNRGEQLQTASGASFVLASDTPQAWERTQALVKKRLKHG